MQGKLLLQQFKDVFEKKGYTFFDGYKPYNLNIVGIRNLNSNNKFDDTLAVIYRDKHLMWKINLFPCTTESGSFYLRNPLNKDGTAVILEGQYKGAYKIGVHGRTSLSGGYQALEQKAPMMYVRDNNRDSKLDTDGVPFSAILKTNIHRSYKNVFTEFIGKYSAGCVVIHSPSDFDVFMRLCEKTLEWGYDNSFTFTLINNNDLHV